MTKEDNKNNIVVTLGCRLNTYESEVIKNLSKKAGLSNTIIINTCAVTAEAERQARQNIRRLKRKNPYHTMVVTGCGAQINPKVYSDMPEVDYVMGNREKMKLETFEKLPISRFSSKIEVGDIMKEDATTSIHPVTSFEGKARAFVEIQNGCNHRCTFCTIPYGRGNSRSLPVKEIIKQVNTLLESGYKEIVLTGVDITDYGLDLLNQLTLGQMIKALLQETSLQRLRLSSLDPAEIDKDLWSLIENEPRLLPHFHLSLQAGSDMILKRMKRRHLRKDILSFCEKIHKHRPHAGLGADIIAGFPTETEEMFQETLSIIKECGLSFLHIFPYSPREGTPAARMPLISPLIIKERALQLREEGNTALKKFLSFWVGKIVTVLVESIKDNQILGKTDEFVSVKASSPSPSPSIKSIVSVKIIGYEEKNMIGKIV